jgi:hypothetical protein
MSTLANLPTPNSYEGMFMNTFNFPPQDFNFYQKKIPVFNQPSLGTSQLRGALHFSDPSYYAYCSEVNINQGTPLNSVTIEFWVKADTGQASSANYLMSYYSEVKCWFYISDPTSLKVYIATNQQSDGQTINTYQSLMDGAWHHIAIVLDVSFGMKFYFDTREIPLANQAIYTPFPDYLRFFVGTYLGSSNLFTDGMIGQVRIWNEARTLADIVANAGRYLNNQNLPSLSLYWSDGYNPTQAKITNSGAELGNDGWLNSSSDDIWDTTEIYGGLNEQNDINGSYTNLTGNAELNGQSIESFITTLTNVETSVNEITMECWVRIDENHHFSETIFGLGYGTTSNIIFFLKNPSNLTITLCGINMNVINNLTSHISITDGLWHHIALTWLSDTMPNLYVDGVMANLINSTQSFEWKTTSLSSWKVALGGRNMNETTIYGGVSEFRVWKSIRTQAEIIQDASYRVQNIPHDLLVYWSFVRRFTSDNWVEDFSDNNNPGYITGGPTWTNTQVFGLLAQSFAVAPPISSSVSASTPPQGWDYGQLDITSIISGGTMLNGAAPGFPKLSVDILDQAFLDARETGYFDPMIFPNIYFANNDDRDSARESISDLSFDTFLAYWIGGRRISFYRGLNEEMEYEFIPIPENYGPTLLLIFDTRITSYYGNIGGGQVVRSFSLMPGESTYVSIETYKKTTEQETDTSSIFDSNNASAQNAFENSLQTEVGVSGSLSAALDFHVSAETKLRWGEGNADVKTNMKANIQANLQAHLQAVSNALSNHAAEQSSQRNVDVNTSYTVTSESGSQTAITREFKNINNSKTLNILFKQMNQEFVVQHMLTNIRVGYFDPAPGSYRTVQLSQLDDLLDQVLISNAATKLSYKNTIVTAAYSALQMGLGTYNINDFIKQRDKVTGVISDIGLTTGTDGNEYPAIQENSDYFINPSATSTFTIADVPTMATGLVLSSDSYVLRTDNVVADLELGLNSGLDMYAQRLQEQAVRREQAENMRIALENSQIAAALDIIDLAISEGSDPQTLAALYRSLMVNPGTTKKIVHINSNIEKSANQ